MRLELTETIGAPIAVVFDVFTDLRRLPEHVASVESVEIVGAGPIGKGTRYRETRRVGGRRVRADLEITSLEPKRSFTCEGESRGLHVRSVHRFVEDGAATRVTVVRSASPATFLARMSWPLGTLRARALRAQLALDHADLEAACLERARTMGA